MTPSPGVGEPTDLETTIGLLTELVRELGSCGDRLESVGSGRVGQIMAELRRRPDLDALPRVLVRAHGEITEAISGIRLTRATIQSYSVDRLRDTHAKLDEVSSTTESAAIEMLDGLDRTLAALDRLQAGGGSDTAALWDALRNEVNQLYGHLQFQDIITQQLRGVAAMLVEVEERMRTVANLFDPPSAPDSEPATAAPDPAAYNPDATTKDVSGRQAQIDAAFRAACAATSTD